jgi:hypothetical protein
MSEIIKLLEVAHECLHSWTDQPEEAQRIIKEVINKLNQGETA